MPLTIFSPAIQTVFKRTYYYSARNIDRLGSVRRRAFGGEYVRLDEQALAERLQHGLSRTQAALDEALAAITKAGIEYRPETQNGQTFEVRITSPLGRAHVQLFKTADLLVLCLDVLHTNGLIEEGEHRHRVYSAKSPLREFANHVRVMRLETESRATPVQEK